MLYIINNLTRYMARIALRNNRSLIYVKYFSTDSPDEIPVESITLIKNILKQQKVQFEEGHTCLIAPCPICSIIKNVQKTENKSKIYINKTTGFFSCYSCKYLGPWKTLQKYILNMKTNEKLSSTSYLKYLSKYPFTKDCDDYKQIMSSTEALAKCTDDRILSVCKIFKISENSLEVLKTLNLRINTIDNKLYMPLIDKDGNTSGFRILELTSTGEINDTKTLPTTECGGVFVAKASRTRDNCGIIVPSLRDALVLLESRVSGSVICLPHGLQMLPLTVLPALERFNKLVLWLGNDVQAWNSARSFAKKLNEKRCYFVRPTDKQPLPHVAITSGNDVKAILSDAQPIWHKSITTFSSLRQDVLSDLQNIDRVQGIKWIRFPALNHILKGHRRGELTVITGPTGCGKTTFISEYSLDLAMQGVNTLWGSFEIRNARLARTMLQQMAGCVLDENLNRFDELADQFEKLPIYFMTFYGQQTIKIVMEAVEHATYMHDIVHVIIDNVQFMMGMSELDSKHIDRFWKQDAIVAAFRMFATRTNCHVTLVIHPRKERDTDELSTSSIFGGAKASQEADNVLIIQDKRLTSMRGKKYLQVAKNRYSGDLGIMPMEFDKSSLSYATKKKTKDTDNESKVILETNIASLSHKIRKNECD